MRNGSIILLFYIDLGRFFEGTKYGLTGLKSSPGIRIPLRMVIV